MLNKNGGCFLHIFVCPIPQMYAFSPLTISFQKYIFIFPFLHIILLYILMNYYVIPRKYSTDFVTWAVSDPCISWNRQSCQICNETQLKQMYPCSLLNSLCLQNHKEEPYSALNKHDFLDKHSHDIFWNNYWIICCIIHRCLIYIIVS